MYKIPTFSKSLIKTKEGAVVEGERIEQKVERLLSNKEPIKDGAPLVYTDKKDGVLPAYDIRTDRFEVAADAMDLVNKAKIAKSEGRKPPKKEEKGDKAIDKDGNIVENKSKDGGTESPQTND